MVFYAVKIKKILEVIIIIIIVGDDNYDDGCTVLLGPERRADNDNTCGRGEWRKS